MEASNQEAMLKKKLQGFLSEMLKMGTVKGFKYFAMYMRGREEMVLSVLNQPLSFSSSSRRESVCAEHKRLSKSESFSSNNLPYDHRSLLLSIRSQMVLSTHGVKDVGLPPASPSDKESLPVDEKSTLFLIAGYGRYNCPYVWVRSNHDRLVKLTGDSSREKDCPLKLKTTLKWKDNDVYVWDVVAEIVKLCTYPSPRNPFAIDFDYFTMLPVSEQVLGTAAMVNLLQKILIHTPDQKAYAGQVFEELQLITKQHYIALEKLVQEQVLPVLQQHEAQTAPRARTTSGHRVRTSSYTQPAQQQYPAVSQYGYAPAMY